MKHDLCVCVRELRGDHGLEGYQRGEKYRYQYDVFKYYRVWPTEGDDYYETCSVRVFNQHFEVEDENQG